MVVYLADDTSVVAYINRQGGLRSRPLNGLTCQILLWSHGSLLSLKAIYIPGTQNVVADILSRQGARPGEWRLHIEWWSRYGRNSARLRWICSRLERPRTVHSGFPCLIQRLSDWMLCPRSGQGYPCTPFPRSLCSRGFWREFAGTKSGSP